jgi:hypothetical protein
MDVERELGPQPLAELMAKHGVAAHDLVRASGEQLTHKMVARAVKGRRLTAHVMAKVARALNRAAQAQYVERDLFTYAPSSNVPPR